jgi:hypothetical protein
LAQGRVVRSEELRGRAIANRCPLHRGQTRVRLDPDGEIAGRVPATPFPRRHRRSANRPPATRAGGSCNPPFERRRRSCNLIAFYVRWRLHPGSALICKSFKAP